MSNKLPWKWQIKLSPRDRMTGTMRNLAFKPYSIFTLTVIPNLVELEHLDKNKNRSRKCIGFLAPTGAQGVTMFVSDHRLLRTRSPPPRQTCARSPPPDVSNLSRALNLNLSTSDSLYQWQVVIWFIWRRWSESSEGIKLNEPKVVT